MRITRNRLRQIVLEELKAVLSEEEMVGMTPENAGAKVDNAIKGLSGAIDATKDRATRAELELWVRKIEKLMQDLQGGAA